MTKSFFFASDCLFCFLKAYERSTWEEEHTVVDGLCASFNTIFAKPEYIFMFLYFGLVCRVEKIAKIMPDAPPLTQFYNSFGI